MDSLENVRAFLAVADIGSFAGASIRLGVAGSVVTKRVSALEKELGVMLFQRTTRSMHLTASGRETIAPAREFLSAYERLASRPDAEAKTLTGRLRIKAPASFTNHFLGKLLNQFFAAHPSVNIELQLANRPVDPLLEGFDFVITGLPASYDGIEEFPLCAFKRLVYASPEYLRQHGAPLHPSDLPSHRCLLYSYLSPVRIWTFTERGAGGVDVAVNGAYATNDIDAMHNAAVDGLGIAVLPRYRASASVAAGLLIPILTDFDLPDFWIKVLRPAHHNNPKLFKALYEYLATELKKLTIEDNYL